MTGKREVHEIAAELRGSGILDRRTQVLRQMSGTTDGYAYTLGVGEKPLYVLKADGERSVDLAIQFHRTYAASPLLPELIYADPANAYLVYAYLAGTTHVNRGTKADWLPIVVTDLLNHYRPSDRSGKWGRVEHPRDSWREFNERSLEGVRGALQGVLPDEDHDRVKALLGPISATDDRRLLHGDTGVHNFVFRDFRLAGVIDPSPMIGPALYDFTYAFCSSPDDLSLATLFAAFELLRDGGVDRTRLIMEVVFQLYCRIGICVRVHPHDLEAYLAAWQLWRTYLPE